MAEQSEKELLHKKAQALWADKRTYKNKLILSGAAMLAACFTYIFFGPLEMVAFSANSFVFTYQDVLWLLLAAMITVTVAGALVISLLRGRIYNYVIAIIFTVTVAGYLQAALLNGSVGALTGEAVEWSQMKREMVLSLTVWLAVFIAVITVMYFHRAFWRNMVIGVSVLLVVMQAAPLVGILLGAYEETKIQGESRVSFSSNGIQEFSEKDNVLVFILDYMDYDYVESIYKEDPAFFDDFRGFTGYSNAVSTFGRTSPSVCNILTGYTEGAYIVPDDEFYSNAWNSTNPNILDALQDKGYSIEMYAHFADIFASNETATNYVDNAVVLENESVKIVPGTMLKKLMYLSIYRYAPTAIKPFFWEYTDFYNDGVLQNLEEYDVYGLLPEATATRSQNSFKLYHLDGAHPPCYLNRNGEYMPTQTNEYEQTIGCLHLMKGILVRMQELGIYENSTIILTADHGDASKLWNNDFHGMQIALFYKPAGSNDAPLVWSEAQVGTVNIPATIANAVGADATQFGIALDDVGTEDHERVFYRVYANESLKYVEQYVDTYTILGNARDFSNWTLKETRGVMHPFY